MAKAPFAVTTPYGAALATRFAPTDCGSSCGVVWEAEGPLISQKLRRDGSASSRLCRARYIMGARLHACILVCMHAMRAITPPHPTHPCVYATRHGLAKPNPIHHTPSHPTLTDGLASFPPILLLDHQKVPCTHPHDHGGARQRQQRGRPSCQARHGLVWSPSRKA